MTRAPSRATSLPPAIDDMVRRLVAHWQPEKIILFGSYARGTANNDSDADLMIVMPIGGPRRPIVAKMYRELADAELPKDLIVITPAELKRDAEDPGSVVYPAVREGLVLYDRSEESKKRDALDPTG